MIRSTRAVAGVVIAFAVAGMGAGFALGQGAGAVSRGAEYREALERATATRLVRSAVILTRTFRDPAVEEFRIGALSLEIAQRLDPGNEELLRLQLEAWRHAQDDEKVLGVTRRLVRLNPSDTVSQLKVITANISSLERIEDRIGAYENLLGPGGDSLDGSIRSRLAFDAALLQREVGDEAAFLDLLQRAIRLDQTNKAAVLLASTLFFERVDDPASRAEMYTQLILADPVDPASHQAFAGELLRHGAFSGAERFITTAATLRAMRMISPDEELLNLYHSIRWGVDGAVGLLEELAKDEASTRYTTDINRRALEEAGEDPSGARGYKPTPVEDRMRALMSSAMGEDEAALRFYDRMDATLTESVQTGVEAGRVSAEQAEELAKRLTAESVRLRAWMGIDLLGAERSLEILVSDPDAGMLADSVDRYRGLLAAHRGEAEEARRLLGGLAADGDTLAKIGLAIAAQGAGDARVAAVRYAEVVRAAPGSVEGLWARERLSQMLGSSVNPSATARRLNTIAAQAPAQLERIIRDPSEHLRLSVRLREGALAPLGPLYADLEMKNTGIFPLAIGNRSPIASRVVVSPKLSIGGATVNSLLDPEFATLARKIRLMPGESVRASAWLGAGPAGAVLESTTPLASSLRVQAIHGYVYSEENGVYNADPFSLEAGSDVVWHRPERPSPAFEEILERFNAAVGDELAEAVLDAQWFFSKSAPSEELAEELSAQKEELANAIAARYASMTGIEQAFTLMGVPGSWQMEETAALDATALAVEPNVYTSLAQLLTRVTGVDSPALVASLTDSDDAVREIAEIMALRFEIIDRAQKLREAAEAIQAERNRSR